MAFNSRILFLLPKAFYTRGTLLKPDFIRRLCNIKNLKAYTEELLRTEYGKYLRELENIISPEVFERDITKRLIDYELLILGNTTGVMQEFIRGYFARHLYNLLGYIIHLKYAHQSVTREELAQKFDLRIEKFFDKKDVIDSLIAAEDFFDALRILKNKKFKEETGTIERLQKLGITGVYITDLALDKGFYGRLLSCYEKLSKKQRLMLKSIMRTFIERYNVLLVLRSVLWSLPEDLIKELLLYHANLHSRLIIPVREFTLASYVDAIEDVSGKTITPENLTTEIIKNIDYMFHRQINRNARHLYLEQVFSIGPIYASILLLEIEISNLTKIAYGIWRKIEPKRIEKTLIL